MEEKERVPLLLGQVKGKNRKLVLQELCPDPRGTKRLYVAWSQSLRVNDKAQSNEGLAFLHCFKTVIAGIR